MSDEPVVDLCGCERFQLWYTEGRRVCRCGHNDGEHLDGRLACVGRVTIRPAVLVQAGL